MNIGYIRVSTIEQDLQNQKNAILNYADEQKIIIDDWIEVTISSKKDKKYRKIDMLFEKLKENDNLIVSELSRLGRSVSDVVGIVNDLIDKGIRLICIKEGIDLQYNHSIQSKVMITMFSLFSELERDLISQRTKEALATKKANGVQLGRPKGPGKSKLDPHKEYIQELIDKEVSMLSMAKIMSVTYPTMYNYIKTKGLKKKA